MLSIAPVSVLLFFIDGLGIGTRGPHNPFDRLDNAEPLAIFQDESPVIPFAGLLAPTDACLGIEGRPQSASGQTTILTGINAPASIGYHKQGFPNQALLDIIREHSIFLQLKRSGVNEITFANTYSQKFFESRPRWISATTAAVEAAGLRFNTVSDLKAGRAVFQDFTNAMLIEHGEPVEPRSPEEAGEVLAGIVAAHQFTLYEYFITDKVGHAQDYEAAARVLQALALFIRSLLARLDLERTTVVLTSDHGNIEDLSVRNHTLNLVPTMLWGEHRERLAARIKSLADITPGIVDVLTKGTQTDGR
ncbi:MAG: 2,3-bisphosphoglycerate-independent phosphoglycerate mutase [Blastocatellia bacterium]|nr:2,3-bisphosphoglycerate-independent phosphoglycerate mutase [Blastocatellia bacterium]